MSKIIGIDIGYGYTKGCVSLDGKRDLFIFPTAVTSYIPKSTFNNSTPIVKVDDQEFLVGNKAVSEGVGLQDTRRKEFVGSSAYFAVLARSVLSAGTPPQEIVLGLPPGHYSKEFVNELRSLLKAVQLSSSNEGDIVIPDTIRFIPQGAGIFFSHVKSNGKNKKDQSKKVVVIDIGYYTLDTLFFSAGRYIENSARSHQLGVSTLHDLVKKEFTSKYREFLSDRDDIDTLLTTGKVQITGQDYEIDTSKILKSYNESVSSLISSYIQQLHESADIILAGGGGVRYIKDISTKYALTTVRDSQFANAIGYQEYGSDKASKEYART